MAIDIMIKQTGLFKKPLTDAVVSPDGLWVGHWNQAGALDDGPAPGGSRVLCDADRPGRGCYVSAGPKESNRAALRQALPCTPRDMEIFYGLVESICKTWGTSRFQQDGTDFDVHDIPQLMEKQRAINASLLRSMADDWANDDLRLVTGAFFPIYMEKDVLKYLQGPDNISFFADYLSEKQRVDAYYAKPSFYFRGGGEILGAYSITEGVDTIVPLEPFVPPLYYTNLYDFNVLDESVSRWAVSLIQTWVEKGELAGKNAGIIPFEQFAKLTKLSEQPRFDDRHVLMRVEDVQKLVTP